MNARQRVTFILLCLTVICTSFCLEVGFYPLLQDTITDYRLAKETLALIFGIAIFLWATTGDHQIKCKNPWLTLLMGYCCIHPFISPKFTIEMLGRNYGGFWEYQCIFVAFIYYGVFCVVSNLGRCTNYMDTFFKILMWCGVISSGYIFLQYLKLDEFQSLIQANYATATHGATLIATFTQPNYSGAFIALMIPFALYFRRWWFAIFMGIAVILITSRMGMIMMGIGVITMCFFRWRVQTTIILTALTGFIIFLWQLFWSKIPLSEYDSGRSGLWTKIIHDCTHPWISAKAYPIFGHGLGFYHSMWALMTPGAMMEAHNEWLQLWMDAGLVGDLLLIFSIFWLIKRLNLYTLKDNQTVVLLAAFFASLGGSCGLFLWQIEPHRLLTVIIFAMLHRKLTMEELSHEKNI